MKGGISVCTVWECVGNEYAPVLTSTTFYSVRPDDVVLWSWTCHGVGADGDGSTSVNVDDFFYSAFQRLYHGHAVWNVVPFHC